MNPDFSYMSIMYGPRYRSSMVNQFTNFFEKVTENEDSDIEQSTEKGENMIPCFEKWYATYKYEETNSSTENDMPIKKLKHQFELLETAIISYGYITTGVFCYVMDLDCDNPYDIYTGDTEQWLKTMVNTAYKLSTSENDKDKKELELITKALCNYYDIEDEDGKKED